MSARLALVAWVLASAAWAQDAGVEEVEVVDIDDVTTGYTPPEEQSHEALRFTGYVDVGFAKATGDGTSWVDSDTRVPLDYGADPFATAVNSRGEVASNDADGRFTNGFLPRSVGIGGNASFLINTASVDVRFQPRGLPIFVFARAQLMPRLLPTGDQTRLELQQAFGRLSPFASQELAFFLGKFDSVFGIEYLENEANFRVGVTPSLIARYTTGHGLGAKVFYRFQLPSVMSAISVNAALTNNGTRIEALVPPDASVMGVPVASARIGYELNLKDVQAKAGFSGLYGPRNDQRTTGARQMAFGADVRLNWGGLSLAGELLQLVDEQGTLQGKTTGQGPAELASGFNVFGLWGRVAYTLPWKTSVLTGVTLYGRYDRRQALFQGYTWVTTQRFTVGGRVDLFELVALKAEGVFNAEMAGAPNVDNDVFTASVVFTW
ncbi:MAG: hypothetical protein AB1938_07310 [Myxococcota bacterium]